MAGYTRQSSYANGDPIDASDTNDEFVALVAAFDGSTGHSHDGTAGNGPVISKIGTSEATTLTLVDFEESLGWIRFWTKVGSTPTLQLYIRNTVLEPNTTNVFNMGTPGRRFANVYTRDLQVDFVNIANELLIPSTVNASSLPTSAGASGTLWNDAGTVKVA